MKVSVIIPSYNRANLLPRTIKGVATQTFKDFEIIVVDDCSTDNTEAVVLQLKKQWPLADIRYIKHDVNKGEAGARNTGIENAKGDYVAFLDSDDEWLENKLEYQLNFLRDNTDKFDGVICENFIINSAANESSVSSFKDNELSKIKLLTHGCGFGIGTNLLLKRGLAVADFDENLRLFADMDWLYRTLGNARIGILHEPLSRYYKSPMRDGVYIKERADIFLNKYQEVISKLSFTEKRKFYSTINWYVAVAYDHHKNYQAAIHHYVRGLWLMPFRHVGNYLNLCRLIYRFSLEKICS